MLNQNQNQNQKKIIETLNNFSFPNNNVFFYIQILQIIILIQIIG